MPLRRKTRALLLAPLAAALAVPVGGATSAAGLSFNVTPNPIFSGDGVLVYGKLSGPGHAGATIVLHERASPATAFAAEASATTEANGFYEFALAPGTVATNRSWYVSAPGGSRSSTAHEQVAAQLTLVAGADVGDTGHPLTFSGQIDPAAVHVGEHVSLQEAGGSSGSGWKTIARGVIDASSSYSIPHDFHVPGAYDLRVMFAGDAQNAEAWSDPVTAVVQQAEHPAFTIGASDPAIAVGQTVTISGLLHAPGSTTPLPGASVTLWGHPHGAPFASLGSATTGSDGSYSFTQMPLRNGSYQVRTASRRTAPLYEAVHALVTLSASSTSSKVGESVTFSGSVTPDKAGGVVELEQMGSHGRFSAVRSRVVDPSSTYAFTLRFGSAGTQTFRVVVLGGDENANGISPTVAITVALPPVQSLPAA